MATQYKTYRVLQRSYINGALYQPGDVARIEVVDPMAAPSGNLEEIVNPPPPEHTASQKEAAVAAATVRDFAVKNAVEVQAKIDAQLAAEARARKEALLRAQIDAEQRARDFSSV
jgi:hypothetical protein